MSHQLLNNEYIHVYLVNNYVMKNNRSFVYNIFFVRTNRILKFLINVYTVF